MKSISTLFFLCTLFIFFPTNFIFSGLEVESTATSATQCPETLAVTGFSWVAAVIITATRAATHCYPEQEIPCRHSRIPSNIAPWSPLSASNPYNRYCPSDEL